MQTELKNYYLKAMDIQTWYLRDQPIAHDAKVSYQTYTLYNLSKQEVGTLRLQEIFNTEYPSEKTQTLLNNMLTSIGLTMEACDTEKKQQCILIMGQTLAQSLLNIKTPLDELRHMSLLDSATQLPIVVTYHPAELLATPLNKPKAWQDLQKFITIS